MIRVVFKNKRALYEVYVRGRFIRTCYTKREAQRVLMMLSVI